MRNDKNKHSGGVSCSACNAFIVVVIVGVGFNIVTRKAENLCGFTAI